MKYNQYEFAAKVWIYPGGKASWHFISVPEDISRDIKDRFGDQKRGWGSLPVEVAYENFFWKTSIFPDSKTNTYLLPIKSEIRKKFSINAEDCLRLLVSIIL